MSCKVFQHTVSCALLDGLHLALWQSSVWSHFESQSGFSVTRPFLSVVFKFGFSSFGFSICIFVCLVLLVSQFGLPLPLSHDVQVHECISCLHW